MSTVENGKLASMASLDSPVSDGICVERVFGADDARPLKFWVAVALGSQASLDWGTAEWAS